MNGATQRCSGRRENLLIFPGTVEIILTQDTQIHSKTLLGMKIFKYQYMELSSKRFSAVFPEFHRVASFMAYTLHPTMFCQSGPSCSKVG